MSRGVSGTLMSRWEDVRRVVNWDVIEKQWLFECMQSMQGNTWTRKQTHLRDRPFQGAALLLVEPGFNSVGDKIADFRGNFLHSLSLFDDLDHEEDHPSMLEGTTAFLLMMILGNDPSFIVDEKQYVCVYANLTVEANCLPDWKGTYSSPFLLSSMMSYLSPQS